MSAALLAGQVAAGVVGGAAVGAAAMALLRRQVDALTSGKSARRMVLAGMLLRLILMGGGFAAALLWSLWCGIAFALAMVATRQVILWKARPKG